MPWLQMKLRATNEEAQLVADTLEECGAIAVTVAAASNELLFDTSTPEAKLWQESWITGLFPEYSDTAAVAQALAQRLGHEPPAVETDLLADQDWAYAWMAHYKPLQVAPRLWICPSWCEPPEPLAVTVMLDPGLAFGTGEHPTTALCLEWLSQENLAGKTLIDYGCGSGILAIAALKLGAAAVTAVDVDSQALEVTRYNAARNGVETRLEVVAPEALAPDATADVVVANILANPLMELAPRLTALVRAGGRLALAGMLREQAEAVRSRYAEHFALMQRERGEWVLLAGTKLP